MNIKEAMSGKIGYLRILNKKPLGSTIIVDAFTKRMFNEIISLLERSGKFEEMWEEHKRGICIPLRVKQLEQKYFPKEAKQDYPESEE